MHPSWRGFFKDESGKPYFAELAAFLKEARATKTIYPPEADVFSAFETDFNAIRVVILGQDPYHGAGQAHGLAFSVRENVAIPRSLRNMFKEIANETGAAIPANGSLLRWATQGVFLLNSALTAESARPGSHRGRGWEIFTDAALRRLDAEREHLAFMLWGNDARAKKSLLNASRHLILEAPHPSPFSANTGFFGCGHFVRANAYLKSKGLPEIDWQ